MRKLRILTMLTAMMTGFLVGVPLSAHAAAPGAGTSTDRSTPLFYRAGDGVTVTGRLDSAGALVDQRNIGPFAAGWTHIVPAGGGRLLFYRAGDGAAVTGRLDSAGALVDQRSVGPFMPGWTHIVPAGGGRLLFYRINNGVAVTGRVDSGGAFVDERNVGPFVAGWTHIAPAGGGRLMFYRAGDGVADAGIVSATGVFTNLQSYSLAPGWTHVVPVGGRVLFYRAGDGVTVTGGVDSAGALVDQRGIGPLSAGWTHIVPAGGGRSMFYRAGDGGTVTGRVDSAGALVDQRNIGPFSTGWTHITDPSDGSQDFVITSSTQRDVFLQGIATPGATIRIAGTVDLDLSGLDGLRIAPGVQIIGDRSVNPRGPRLFTTTIPVRLLYIGDSGGASDHVRITGIRLDGGRGGVIAPSSATGGTGISVFSSVDVEIDHNEIYGWQSTGVFVDDAMGRISLANATTVHIHDNFVHHNQHYREEGYGIATHGGAYALIDRNVFDYNRHALEGDGRTGTGYLAYRNLFLTGGGVNSEPGGGLFEINTHMLDMHGTENCLGFTAYCGQAGEYMDIEYNTILYTAGTGFKLRGDPTVGASVGNNVFAHDQVWGGWLDDAAMVGTDDNLGINAWFNQFGLNTFNDRKTCDFDGDSTADAFIATGVTWWYSSSRLAGQWVYLNDSYKRVNEVTLGDVTGDGRCDVTAGGVVYNNGASSTAPTASPNLVPNITDKPLANALNTLGAAGYGVGMQFDLQDSAACAHVGEVVRQDPPAGTVSLPRTFTPKVNIWVMQMPKIGVCG